MIKQILRFTGLIFVIATLAVSFFQPVGNTSKERLTLPLILLSIAAVILIAFLIVDYNTDKIKNKNLEKWKLFGSYKIFWLAFVLLFISLLFLLLGILFLNFSPAWLIGAHFPILAILYFGNEYYSKKIDKKYNRAS